VEGNFEEIDKSAGLAGRGVDSDPWMASIAIEILHVQL
jgi:hypothetical protein